MQTIFSWWQTHTATDIFWLVIGLTGQAMFSIRWLTQWIASEKSRQSIVPESFWYLSFTGGILVLAYGIYRADPVIVVGQFGLLVYARNLYLIVKSKGRLALASD